MYSCIYGLYLSIYHSYGCNYVNVPGNSVRDLLILQIVGGVTLKLSHFGHVFHHPKKVTGGIARMLVLHSITQTIHVWYISLHLP